MNALTRLHRSINSGRLALAGLLFLGVVGLLAPQAARAQETPLFTFAQISDSQAETSVEQARLEEVLDALAAGGQAGALIPHPVDFVLLAGDLVDSANNAGEWATFVDTVDTRLTVNGIPYLAVPGNHDLNGFGAANYEQFIASTGVWESGVDVLTGHNGESVSLGWTGLRFIGFNTFNPSDNQISAEDLARVDRRTMDAGAQSQNVFLVGHHPHNSGGVIPLAATLENSNVIGYAHGHTGDPQATSGLSGISNPNVWRLSSQGVFSEGTILYYEVFQTEIRVHVIQLALDPLSLPAAVTIPLIYVMLPAGPPVLPTADFNASPLSGDAPLMVAFTNASTGSPTSRLWDFGDGNTSAEQHPTHIYEAAGTYDVSLTVFNSAGSDTLVRTGLVEVSPAPPSMTYVPNADAHVRSTFPTTNYGNADNLRLRTDLEVYQTHLKFDVTGLAGLTALSAKLRLYVTDGSTDGGTLYQAATDSWSELGITWDTAPAASGAALDSAGAVAGGTWEEFDVSSLVDRDGSYAFVITSDSSNSAFFSSREGANPPELVVQTGPATMPVSDFVGGPRAGNAPLTVDFRDLSSGPPTVVLWDFGDGTTSMERDPSHTYHRGGRYDVTLTTANSLGVHTQTKLDYVLVDPPIKPVAGFSADATTGPAPIEVSFSDLSTGTPAAWFWNFGDGSGSLDQNPTHTYTKPGVYDVTLTVANGAGSDTSTQSALISVQPGLPTFQPIADARVKDTNPTSNYGDEDFLRVRSGITIYDTYLMFDVSDLPEPNVTSATLRLYSTANSVEGGTVSSAPSSWSELGIIWDNAPGASSAPLASAGAVGVDTWIEFDVSSAIAGEGIHSFVLTSPSSQSAYYSSREGAHPPVLILETGPAVAPVVDFDATPVSGEAPLTVSFTDLTTGLATSWLWDFGDGNTSTEQHPAHTYTTPGSYDVSLTATNAVGSDTLDRLGLIDVTVANAAPAVSISAPTAGTSHAAGSSITFTGNAIDDLDGDLSSSISWSSDVQGALGTGASISRSDLQVGAHVITASATDGGGLTGTDQVSITITGANAPPVVTITAPANGTSEVPGISITFAGTALDDFDGDLSSSISWSSDFQGALGTSASISRSDLLVGVHVITASATDGGGLTGTDQISITISAINTPPVVTITAPANGSSHDAGSAITFAGTALDDFDGDLSSSVSWSSNLQGALGAGASLSRSDLQVGAHLITASATDSGGLTDTHQIAITVAEPRTAPAVTITAPADGTSALTGTTITFAGTALDDFDGFLSSSLSWSSSLQGALGSGASVSRSDLQIGTHLITASVTNSAGLTGTDQIAVTINGPNTAPVVTITAPADGSTAPQGSSITFTGTAPDDIDIDLSSSISWSSNVQGALGTGASVSRSDLQVGAHVITASATDSGGLTATDQITITVTGANAAPVVSITAPADGTSRLVGTSVTFTGTSFDDFDGDLSSIISWSSSLQGALGSGDSISRSDLQVGIHLITASATDVGGLTGTDQIAVTITAPNTAPDVTITAPGAVTSSPEGSSVTFNGTALDDFDGDLSSSISWSSSLDGALGTGASISRSDLQLGTHLITASATDGGGLTGTALISLTITDADAIPVVTITAPADGTSQEEGSTVTFAGTAVDDFDGFISSSISWSSDLEGALGSGASVSRSDLQIGTHVITASATNSSGLTGTDQISITITAASASPPVVSITAPTDGTSQLAGTTMTFAGTAHDERDGYVSSSLAWSSDLQGALGSGASVSRSDLQLGTHLITASTTNSVGLTGTDQISVTITTASSASVDGTFERAGSAIMFAGTSLDDLERGHFSNLT